MTKNLFMTLSIFSALSLASAVTQAGEKKAGSLEVEANKTKSACQADIQMFCSDIPSGEGRIAACLKSKGDQVSETCREAKANFSSMISKKVDKANVAFRKDCGTDITKFCSEVPTGKGRILECLGEHDTELSKSCKSFQAKINKKLNEALG